MLLLGAKAGDNAQIRSLAALAGARAHAIKLRFNALHRVPNSIAPSSLLNLTVASREALASCACPDLIISAGKRSYRAARYLKSRWGNAVRWIHIGRPWGAFAPIDLILTTPQYRLPAAANVLTIPYPISTLAPAAGVASAAVERRAGEWVVLVGGNSSSHRFDRATTRALRDTIEQLAAGTGTRITVLSSRRTPANVSTMLASLRARDCCWIAPTVAAHGKPSRVYATLLARADGFVVTGDSASMIGDALDTHRPVRIVPVAARRGARVLGGLARLAGCANRVAGHLLRRAVELGWITYPRSMQAMIDGLAMHAERKVESGLVSFVLGADREAWKLARDAVAGVLEELRSEQATKPRDIPTSRPASIAEATALPARSRLPAAPVSRVAPSTQRASQVALPPGGKGGGATTTAERRQALPRLQARDVTEP